MTRFHPRLDRALWATQGLLALVAASSGIGKALLPATTLQGTLGLLLEADPAILRPVGVVELGLAFALLLPAGTRLFPRITPFAAICLGASALLGLAQPATAGGLGWLPASLALLPACAFVAWGRLVAAPIDEEAFGEEPARISPEAAARLERNRQRHAARHEPARRVA